MGVELDRRKLAMLRISSSTSLSVLLFGDEYEICLLYLVLTIAVPRSYRLVPLTDPLTVFVGFLDLGELLEEYLRTLLLVIGPLRFALEKETP